MTAAALLLLGQALATPPTWTSDKVAVHLHPVRHDPLLHRWHAEMGRRMAGPSGSVVFRSMASRMDANLRIAEFDGVMPYMSRDRQRRTVELAFNGASLGWQWVATDLIRDSDGLDEVRGVFRSIVNPSIKVQGGGQGRGVQVAADEESNREDLATAALIDPTAWGLGPKRRQPPSLRTGFSGTMVSNLDPALEGDGYDEERPYRLAGRGFVQISDAGVDAVRLSVTGRPGGDFRTLGVTWSGIARQELGQRMALIGEVYGGMDELSAREDDFLPHFFRSSVDVQVAPQRRWIVRTSLARADRGDLGMERIAEVSLRVNTRWRLPWSAQGYPRGQVPGAPGAPGPRLPDRTPNPTAPAVLTPVERLALDLDAPAPERPVEELARQDAVTAADLPR